MLQLVGGDGCLSEQSVSREELERQILDVIIAEGNIDPSLITPEATLESLAVESMDIVMILMAIEEKFSVYVPIDGQIAESKDLAGFVRSLADHIIAHHG